jgi:hypothetical protein
MDLGPGMAGDQADDALHLRRIEPVAMLDAALAQAVEP